MTKKDVSIDAKCGLVMPISEIDGCTEKHWQEVKGIITEAVEDAGFTANLVSYADDVGIIQKRIIQNLYENPIVVCDVSGKNPNVMFELGLRLAFDKPIIIIKDDKTSYSFDTSPIEHLEYPRDLRFTKIVEFKEALNSKVKATYEASIKDPNHTTFLKHFGTFTAAKIDTKEVSKEDYIIEEMKEIRKIVERQDQRYSKVIANMHTVYPNSKNKYNDIINYDFIYPLNTKSYPTADEIKKAFKDHDKREELIDYLYGQLPKSSEYKTKKDFSKAVDQWLEENN